MVSSISKCNFGIIGKKGVLFCRISRYTAVWYCGLLYKIKSILPAPYYLVLKSFLSERNFYAKVSNEISSYGKIEARIPQGSVLGPILYTIYNSDMSCLNNVTVATYADNTPFLATI